MEKTVVLKNDEDLQVALDEAFKHWHEKNWNKKHNATTLAIFESLKASVKHYAVKHIKVNEPIL